MSSDLSFQQPLFSSASYKIYKDCVVQGECLSKAISPTQLISNYQFVFNVHPIIPNETEQAQWKLSKDISPYPKMSSDFPISDAIYNLSLEEMINAIEPDSTLRTGKEWSGVWTRDISYSIILSMAHMQPEVAKNSLLKKVNGRKKIIQDTGTGGAWPVSSDRMIWAAAAWEIYLSTGDQDWLKQAYEIISNSLQDDYLTIYDSTSGLVKGESSFLDWREQTYPAWMQPADIFESRCLSTNAVHYQANRIASEMADLLHQPDSAKAFNTKAEEIKRSINKQLWMPAKNYYAQYLYGRGDQFKSPRADALGEALTVLFDIAEPAMQAKIVQHTPVTEFGIPCIYPDIPGIPPYHNNGIWPFVQAFWLQASAKTGNETAVLESIGAIYRASAMFLTNKENFVAENGDFRGTQINSSNMLWSLAGNIALVQKVLFGLQFTKDRLVIEPFIPKTFSGKRVLSNIIYRNAILSIEIEGYGNKIESFYLNGVKTTEHFIDKNQTGNCSIKIVMGEAVADQEINKVSTYTSLMEPKLNLDKNRLYWLAQASVKQYKLFRNGELIKLIPPTETSETISRAGRYQLIAVDELGVESFASEPVVVGQKEQLHQLNKMAGSRLNFSINIEQTGSYELDILYANGNGPVNTDNKCAIRTLFIDGIRQGVVVFPQRGKDNWSVFGYSNLLRMSLPKGNHTISIELLPYNENMSGTINEAFLKNLRLRNLE